MIGAHVFSAKPKSSRRSPDNQLHRSIQGVWRNIARVIPATTNPGDRLDPFAHVPVGTQTDVQPGLLIFTVRHYSRTMDIAVQPRPTTGYAIPGKPTLEEVQVRNGDSSRPMQARNQLTSDTLTLRVIVSKEPSDQAAGGFARLRVQLEDGILSLTPIERPEERSCRRRYVEVRASRITGSLTLDTTRHFRRTGGGCSSHHNGTVRQSRSHSASDGNVTCQSAARSSHDLSASGIPDAGSDTSARGQRPMRRH